MLVLVGSLFRSDRRPEAERRSAQVSAQSLVDMHAAKDNGLDSSEPRTPENTTPTSFRQWCEEVLKPAFLK
jgi:hypothetical protein